MMDKYYQFDFSNYYVKPPILKILVNKMTVEMTSFKWK